MSSPRPPRDGAPGATTANRTRRQPTTRPAGGFPTELAPWPPEPFPGPTEQPPMRPAPMRVLTTKVASPPPNLRTPVVTRVQPAAAASSRSGAGAAPATQPKAPTTVTAGNPTVVAGQVGSPASPASAPAAWSPRPTGDSPRGPRWLVVVVLLIAASIGGAIGYVVTRDDADHVSASTVAPTSVPRSATPSPTTASAAPAPTTAPPTTAPGPNALGIVVGTPADPASSRPEERFAAHLGHDEGEATASSPAALYAMWWELIQGAPAGVVASANGFAFADAAGQTIELSGFTSGADGKVADLVECAHVGDARPTCNRVSNVISLDPGVPMVGQSATVTFGRLGEVRLVQSLTTRLVTMTSTKAVTAATSPTGDVRFNDHVLAFVVPSAAVPSTVDVTLTYADGTSEVVTITV